MDLILLNGIGFIAALSAMMVVTQTLVNWKGILREWLYLLLFGFSFFAIGFLWNIFGLLGLLPRVEMFFFAMGMIFVLWGANKILSFTKAQDNLDADL